MDDLKMTDINQNT